MVRPERNARNAPSAGPLRTVGARGERTARARRSPTSRIRPAGARLRGAMVLLLIPLCGCTGVSSLGQWRAAYDGNLFKRLSPEEMADASGPADSTNLFQRWLTPRINPAFKSADSSSSTLELGSDGWRPMVKPVHDPVADAELDAALKLFRQGKFEEAEKQFAKIAKERKQSTWGENAAFYLAECQYQQKKYTKAHNSYELLYKDYPATNYKEKLTEREFELGKLWLAQSDPQIPAEKKLPWTARFDGRLPIIDSQGTGIQALEHAQHNDPLGPVSDKAAIEVADFHMKHEDYETASEYYEMFLKEFAGRKTSYIQYAQLAAIDARMKGYLGPEYDAAGLEKARADQADDGNVTRAPGQLREALPHARPDQRRRCREDLPDRHAVQEDEEGHLGGILPPQGPPSDGPTARGPSRPRPSWRSSRSCRASRPSPAGCSSSRVPPTPS